VSSEVNFVYHVKIGTANVLVERLVYAPVICFPSILNVLLTWYICGVLNNLYLHLCSK